MQHLRPDYQDRIVDLAALHPEKYPGVRPIGPNEKVFILLERDLLAPYAVAAYAQRCKNEGSARHDQDLYQLGEMAEKWAAKMAMRESLETDGIEAHLPDLPGPEFAESIRHPDFTREVPVLPDTPIATKPPKRSKKKGEKS